MENATHYIEQWTDKSGNTHLGKVLPIKDFNHKINRKKWSRGGFKTTAVFWIRLKQQGRLAVMRTNLSSSIIKPAINE